MGVRERGYLFGSPIEDWRSRLQRQLPGACGLATVSGENIRAHKGRSGNFWIGYHIAAFRFMVFGTS